MKQRIHLSLLAIIILASCNGREKPVVINNENVAGSWKLVHYEEQVFADGHTETEDATDEFGYERYVFYSDGTGYERDDGGSRPIKYTLQNGSIRLSDQMGSEELSIKKLTESTMVLEVKETDEDEMVTMTGTFKKIHDETFSIKDFVGKWNVEPTATLLEGDGSEFHYDKFLIEIDAEGNVTRDGKTTGKIEVNSHEFRDEGAGDIWDIAYYDYDDIELFIIELRALLLRFKMLRSN